MPAGIVGDQPTCESVNKKRAHELGKPRDGTIADLYSAHLLGNRIQCVENMFRQFARRLVSELGMRPDGVTDQFETLDVG